MVETLTVGQLACAYRNLKRRAAPTGPPSPGASA